MNSINIIEHTKLTIFILLSTFLILNFLSLLVYIIECLSNLWEINKKPWQIFWIQKCCTPHSVRHDQPSGSCRSTATCYLESRQRPEVAQWFLHKHRETHWQIHFVCSGAFERHKRWKCRPWAPGWMHDHFLGYPRIH